MSGGRTYSFAGNVVALRDGSVTDLSASPKVTGIQYVFADEQRSVRATMSDPRKTSYGTDSYAATYTQNAYLPFGQTRGADEVTATDRGWLGQVADGDTTVGGTGLVYLNSRYFDPASSRFVSPDPVLNISDPSSLDAYVYGAGNPVSFTDPGGRCYTGKGERGYEGSTLEGRCGIEWTDAKLREDCMAHVNGGCPDATVDAMIRCRDKGICTTGKDHKPVMCSWSICRAKGATWGSLGTPDPVANAVFNFFIGDDANQCVSGSGWWAHTSGCGGLVLDVVPGFDEGKWGVKGVWKGADGVLHWITKGGDAAAKVRSAEEAGDIIRSAERTGSALKTDAYHLAPDWVVDDIADNGTVFQIIGGDGVPATLVQMPGEVNGVAGRYEWIVQGDVVTHQRFVPGGSINGVPNQP